MIEAIGAGVAVIIVIVVLGTRRRLSSGPGRSTHLQCPKCAKEFDYVLSSGSYLVHAPGNVTIVTSDGQEHVASSVKLWNRHDITCPYCDTKSWYRVNI